MPITSSNLAPEQAVWAAGSYDFKGSTTNEMRVTTLIAMNAIHPERLAETRIWPLVRVRTQCLPRTGGGVPLTTG